MFCYLKNELKNPKLNNLKERLNNLISKENLTVNQKICLGFAYGKYQKTNIYYCNQKSKKISKFIQNIFINYGGQIRCYSFMPNKEYDIYIEVGYIDNIDDQNYIDKAINILYFTLKKAYMILDKGYYFLLDI